MSMRKNGVPLLFIVVGGFVLSMYRNYLFFPGKETVYAVLEAIFLFILGTQLNDHCKTRGDTWLKKMIIMFLFILFVLNYIRVINISSVNIVLDLIGINTLIYYCLFIYFGYIFFS